MEYPTDDDLKDLPQVILTSDVPWDPRRYDLNRSDQATVLGSHGLPPAIVSVHEGFNQFGEILNVEKEDPAFIHQAASVRIMSTLPLMWMI